MKTFKRFSKKRKSVVEAVPSEGPDHLLSHVDITGASPDDEEPLKPTMLTPGSAPREPDAAIGKAHGTIGKPGKRIGIAK